MNTRSIVKRLIDFHKFKQHELAEISGLSQGRISQIYLSTDDAPATCSFEAGKKLSDKLAQVELIDQEGAA